MIGNRLNSFRIKRRNSRILFSTLLIVSMLIFLGSRGNDDAFKRSRAATEGIGATALTYLTLPIRGIENFFGDVGSIVRAHSENQRMTKELAKLSDVEARANAMAIKLSRLENILNVDIGSGIPERKIAARAVSEMNGPFLRAALINAGSKDGVTEGDAVMTVNGLYGHVIRTGAVSSRVLKLEDLNSRIAVMSEKTQSRAILIGDNSSVPELGFETSDSVWEEGDTVITSGDDGLLPMGLPIGTVNLSGNGRIKVNLFVHKDFVDWVWVYPYESLKAPEDNPTLELQIPVLESEIESTTEVTTETPL